MLTLAARFDCAASFNKDVPVVGFVSPLSTRLTCRFDKKNIVIY